MKAIVMGAGPGGLFTAAILSKMGVEVTVLEKNHGIGGGMQSFTRFGERFDTGMHVVGGFGKGGNIKALCNWLGIGDKIEVKEVDRDSSDRVYIQQDGKSYTLASGRENFTKRLIAYFPDQHNGIEAYIEAIYRIASEIDVYNLRENHSENIEYSQEQLTPVNRFIEKYVTDPKLQALLAWMNSYYSGVRDTTPTYIHALLQVLYIEGSYRFVGGSSRFAKLLEDVVCQNGGRVLSGSQVVEIRTAGKKVVSVKLEDGSEYSADSYISAFDPTNLPGLVDRPEVFSNAYRRRLLEIKPTYSAFSIFIKFHPECMPFMNYTGFISRSYRSVWHFSDEDLSWPQGLLYTTPPEGMDDKWAEKMIVMSPMMWSSVEKWEDTQLGRRPDDYKRWKNECCEKMISMLEDVFPDIRTKIDRINTASPLTIRDYFLTRNGSMSGFLRDCNHIERTILPIRTKLENLFLTGQNINLHGFFGVALTAMLTSETVLNRHDIVETISKFKD